MMILDEDSEAMRQRDAAWENAFRWQRTWAQPVQVDCFEVGQYTRRYTRDYSPCYEECTLTATVTTCGAPGEWRLLLCDQNGRVEYTCRWRKNGNKYALVDTAQCVQVLRRGLPVVVNNLGDFARHFRGWIDKPQIDSSELLLAKAG